MFKQIVLRMLNYLMMVYKKRICICLIKWKWHLNEALLPKIFILFLTIKYKCCQKAPMLHKAACQMIIMVSHNLLNLLVYWHFTQMCWVQWVRPLFLLSNQQWSPALKAHMCFLQIVNQHDIKVSWQHRHKKNCIYTATKDIFYTNMFPLYIFDGDSI